MKKSLNKSPKRSWSPICLIILIIIFFSIRLIITYDSAHYLNYVSIFEDNLPFNSWDIVRGPVFPITVFLFDTLFGKTGTGILVGTFIFYSVFVVVCYHICKEICQNYKHKTLIQNIFLAILILNPLIMGYFHVLLTEFIAITVTVLNILIAYKWLYCDTNNKKKLIVYSLYFIINIAFCYHLKQSYIIVSLVPLIISAVASIVRRHTKKNVLYRIGAVLLSFIFLIVSIVTWDNILISKGVNMDTGRDSSSMLSQQLLKAYQITYDLDGDGENDPLSTPEAVGVLFQNYFNNPAQITEIYISNYCGLTSICTINTENGIEYTPTLDFAGVHTFENTAIGYRAYSDYSNIFDMTEHLYDNAIVYNESTDRSLIAQVMSVFLTPTDLLFKLSMVICVPCFVFLIIVGIHRRAFSKLFILNFLLLATASLHLIFSAGVGLIIDRYAIEAFIPSLLGLFGTITYYYHLPKHLKS